MIPVWITKNPQTWMIRWLSSSPSLGRQILKGLGYVPVHKFSLQGDQQFQRWLTSVLAVNGQNDKCTRKCWIILLRKGSVEPGQNQRNLTFHGCVLQRHRFISLGNGYLQGRSLEGTGRTALDLCMPCTRWVVCMNPFLQSPHNFMKPVPLLPPFSTWEN